MCSMNVDGDGSDWGTCCFCGDFRCASSYMSWFGVWWHVADVDSINHKPNILQNHINQHKIIQSIVVGHKLLLLLLLNLISILSTISQAVFILHSQSLSLNHYPQYPSPLDYPCRSRCKMQDWHYSSFWYRVYDFPQVLIKQEETELSCIGVSTLWSVHRCRNPKSLK